MARTIRTIGERTRQWLLAPDINHATGKTHEISKAWGRYRQRLLRGQDGVQRHSKAQTATIDNHGGFKIQNWCSVSSKDHSDVSRKRRAAGKRLAIIGIEDHFDALEDHGKIFDWRGYSHDNVELWYEQIGAEHDAFYDELYRQELENDAREAEYERRMNQEMDDIFFLSFDYDYSEYQDY